MAILFIAITLSISVGVTVASLFFAARRRGWIPGAVGLVVAAGIAAHGLLRPEEVGCGSHRPDEAFVDYVLAAIVAAACVVWLAGWATIVAFFAGARSVQSPR